MRLLEAVLAPRGFDVAAKAADATELLRSVTQPRRRLRDRDASEMPERSAAVTEVARASARLSQQGPER